MAKRTQPSMMLFNNRDSTHLCAPYSCSSWITSADDKCTFPDLDPLVGLDFCTSCLPEVPLAATGVTAEGDMIQVSMIGELDNLLKIRDGSGG